MGDIPSFPNSRGSSTPIPIGATRPEAPTGTWIARCVHVEPAWTFLGNRKVALYFEVAEGEHTGATARKFYRLKHTPNGWVIAPKSNLMRDVRRLSPDMITEEGIDPVSVFINHFFKIRVTVRLGKDGITHAIAEEVDYAVEF